LLRAELFFTNFRASCGNREFIEYENQDYWGKFLRAGYSAVAAHGWVCGYGIFAG
jgi:hypothetical protein